MLYFSLDHNSIAAQTAYLINSNNQLGSTRTAQTILGGKTHYVVELHGRLVIGAVGTEHQGYTVTEIKHLVVHPDWRNRGIAQHLVRRALAIADTPMSYVTVRGDNLSSLNLFDKMEFIRAGEYFSTDHTIILLTKASNKWRKSTGSKQPLSGVTS